MRKALFILLGVITAMLAMPASSDALAVAVAHPTTKLVDLGFIGLAGMLVNKSALSSIFIGLKTLFNGALKASPGEWAKTAMEVPSTSEGEDYVWLSRFPRMRKWIGEKFIKNLEAGKYYAKNEDWEATVAVLRNHIEDDRIGIYNMQAQAAGESAGELNDIIVDDLKNSAFTVTGIDGQFYYDTDHEVAGASVSNKGTAALSAATSAAAAASLGVAVTAIMNFKDDEGMPLRLIPDILEVPPALRDVANKLATADKLDDNSPNPYKGTLTVLINPGLTSATGWMIHVTRKVVKPFIVQMRKRPVFVTQTTQENDDVFNLGEYKFGAEARATGVYGFWQLSYGSTGV